MMYVADLFHHLQKPVGLQMMLLWQSEGSPNRPDFLLRRIHYAPQILTIILTHSEPSRDETLSPTDSLSIKM